MDNPIANTQIGHLQPVMPNSIIKPESLDPIQQTDGDSFSKVLKDSIDSVNKLQQNANDQVEKLAKGEIKDVHQVMIAMQEASLTFKLMMKVRNQILSAYQEISKGS